MRLMVMLMCLMWVGCGTSSVKVVETGRGADQPFAKVSMTLHGCTSCAPCRSTIRQVVHSSSGAPQVSFGDRYTSAVMVYPTPQEIPLRNVYTNLLSCGLNDVSIESVVLEASGVIRVDASGSSFVLSGTHQTFPVEEVPVELQATAKEVRIRALVKGLESEGTPILLAQEIQVATMQ